MRLVPFIALLCALGACGGDKKAGTTQTSTSQQPAVEATPAAATGSIEGVIVLAEGATLPKLSDPLKTSKLVVTNPPRPCTPVSESDLEPVKQASDGGLSSVHVALTGMESTAPAEPKTHELRLENCRLNQFLLGARLGDRVRITNASDAPLLPSVLGDTFMEAILANQSRTVDLKRVGASRIACNFGAYCGQTDLLVTSHSLFAVSDKAGHYRIDNVPLDRELTVHAWHPLFEESRETITLTKAAPTRTIKLVLKPTPVIPTPTAQPTPATPAKTELKTKPKADKILVQ